MKREYKSLLILSICASQIWVNTGCFKEEPSVDSSRDPYQMITGDDSRKDRSHWDKKFSTGTYVYGKEPAEFLRKHVDRLPLGHVLDIAMGEGRNAVFLAQKGFSVDGVDISNVALRKARNLAREYGVTVNTIRADLATYQIKKEFYDVILNINFLDRRLIPKIKAGLRPGGMIVYEVHTVAQLSNPGGENMRRDWVLESGELKNLFSDLKILVYEEMNDGKEAKARLIATK